MCNSTPASLITVGSFIADQGKGSTVPWLPVCWGATVSTQKKSHGRFVHSRAGGFVRMCGWMCKVPRALTGAYKYLQTEFA